MKSKALILVICAALITFSFVKGTSRKAPAPQQKASTAQPSTGGFAMEDR